MLEQRVIHAQRRLLTGTRMRVEVCYVEILRGTPVSADDRAQLIANREAEERTCQTHRPRSDARPPQAQPDGAAREAALDQAPEQLMLRVAEADDMHKPGELRDESDAATTPCSGRSPGRPRRRAAEVGPVADALLSGDTASEP